MEPSAFTRIIKREAPAHWVYEDDNAIAIMTITPSVPGHTLVIPKKQVARLEDMEEADYLTLMQAVKKVMRRMVEVFGPDYRIGIKIAGFHVPHVHVHVIPCKTVDDYRESESEAEPDHEALAAMAKRLAFK